jgi:hypothetical protein
VRPPWAGRALAEQQIEHLRDLLRSIVSTHRLTNRYDEALLLVPADLWRAICDAAEVDPASVPGSGPDSAVGEAAEETAAAGDAPPGERSA